MISFSSAALNKTRDLLVENKRDLRAAVLSPFYEVDQEAQRDVQARYLAVLESRTNTSLGTISSGQFGVESSVSGGLRFFLKVLASSGVEEVSADDLTTRTRNTLAAPRLAAFIDKQARTIPLNQDALLPMLGSEAESTTKHLIVGDPGVVFDEDPVIFARLRNTHKYLRDLIK